MLPNQFGVNWLLGLGAEAKNRFGYPGFPTDTILAIFDLQVTLMLPSKFGLSVQEKKQNIDFQDGGHLGFQIRTILAIFDLQVTLMLLSKF